MYVRCGRILSVAEYRREQVVDNDSMESCERRRIAGEYEMIEEDQWQICYYLGKGSVSSRQ